MISSMKCTRRLRISLRTASKTLDFRVSQNKNICDLQVCQFRQQLVQLPNARLAGTKYAKRNFSNVSNTTYTAQRPRRVGDSENTDCGEHFGPHQKLSSSSHPQGHDSQEVIYQDHRVTWVDRMPSGVVPYLKVQKVGSKRYPVRLFTVYVYVCHFCSSAGKSRQACRYLFWGGITST